LEKKTFYEFQRIFQTHHHLTTIDWYLIYQHIDSTIELFVDNLGDSEGLITTDRFCIKYFVFPAVESIIDFTKLHSDIDTQYVFGFKISFKKDSEKQTTATIEKKQEKTSKKKEMDKTKDWEKAKKNL
jgi:hypothetical protein